MTIKHRMLPSITTVVFLAAFAPSLASAGPHGTQAAANSYLPDPGGYSMSAPQASAVNDKMDARIEARVATNCSNAWQVFTDFDGMPRFLPGMEVSKVVSREAGHVTLMQRGRHQYGILSKHYQSERELTMNEPALIESRSLPGDELAIASTTSFTPTERDGCVIASSATIELPFWVPGATAVGFIKSLASAQMQAMLAEVERRYR